MISKFSRNLSFISRCHWNERFAGVTISVRLDEPAGLELFEQKPGHDGFSGPRVVGQEESDAREFEEVSVDRFKLMGQRVDAGDR